MVKLKILFNFKLDSCVKDKKLSVTKTNSSYVANKAHSDSDSEITQIIVIRCNNCNYMINQQQLLALNSRLLEYVW